MAADFDDVFTGVRTRAGNHVQTIQPAPGLAGTRVFADVTEQGATRLERIRHPKQRTSNLGGPIAAYAHDADPAPSGRRGDGNDRIVLA